MCECVEFEDGEMHLCVVCADEWRDYRRSVEVPVDLVESSGVRCPSCDSYVVMKTTRIGCPRCDAEWKLPKQQGITMFIKGAGDE